MRRKLSMKECEAMAQQQAAVELAKLENELRVSPVAERCVEWRRRKYYYEKRRASIHLGISAAAFVTVVVLLLAAHEDKMHIVYSFYGYSGIPSTLVQLYQMSSSTTVMLSAALIGTCLLGLMVWIDRTRTRAKNLVLSAQTQSLLEVAEIITYFVAWVLLASVVAVINGLVLHINGDPMKIERFLELRRTNILWDVLMTSSSIIVLLPSHFLGFADSMASHVIALLLFMYTLQILWQTLVCCFAAVGKPKPKQPSGSPGTHKASRFESHEWILTATALLTSFLHVGLLLYVVVAYHGLDSAHRPLFLYEMVAAVIYGLQVLRKFLEVVLKPLPPPVEPDPVDDSDFSANGMFDHLNTGNSS
ncbi:hypothetical protein Pelo_13148 [Pelomyxa schiedti]|nr:hypothetical protein Pelo_13148 [Pelomyxa schiedti]